MPTIKEKIKEYLRKPAYPLHMPGHKRRPEVCLGGENSAEDKRDNARDSYEHDFTEIDGFDVLSHPTGIIAESQRRAAELFGADKTYYLVNGSTVGILAGILAAADPDKCVLLGPDCHKAVYHALELGRLSAVDADGTPVGNAAQDIGLHASALTNLADIERELDWAALPTRIERTLAAFNKKVTDGASREQGRDVQTADAGQRNESIGLVVITSPTYEGVISDIARIAEIAHRYGALLMVDEAHGAHLGMHPAFGENSNRLGADLVVHSMHKTMTGLTQTALLHVNDCAERHGEGETPAGTGKAGTNDNSAHGDRMQMLCARIEYYLEMLQTSSPSYLLMESMDRCIDLLTRESAAAGTQDTEKGAKNVDKHSPFCDYAGRLEHFRGKLEKLSYISLFKTEHFDPGKLVLTVKDNEAGCTALMLYAVLRDKYGLQLEFAQDEYALAMTSFVDTDEAFDRLYAALAGIDAALAAGKDPADMQTAFGDEAKDTAGAAGAQREPSFGDASVIRKTDCYQDHTL